MVKKIAAIPGGPFAPSERKREQPRQVRRGCPLARFPGVGGYKRPRSRSAGSPAQVRPSLSSMAAASWFRRASYAPQPGRSRPSRCSGPPPGWCGTPLRPARSGLRAAAPPRATVLRGSTRTAAPYRRACSRSPPPPRTRGLLCRDRLQPARCGRARHGAPASGDRARARAQPRNRSCERSPR